MLVMLIIFMVITPMLQKGVQVDLAKVNNPIEMKDADKEFSNLKIIPATINLRYFATKCKHPDFAAEDEWRLVLEHDPDVYNDCEKGMQFHDRGGRHLVPHAVFPIDPAKNPIRDIWLGPRNTSGRNTQAVRELLRKSGYDTDNVEFHYSKIPLRPDY